MIQPRTDNISEASRKFEVVKKPGTSIHARFGYGLFGFLPAACLTVPSRPRGPVNHVLLREPAFPEVVPGGRVPFRYGEVESTCEISSLRAPRSERKKKPSDSVSGRVYRHRGFPLDNASTFAERDVDLDLAAALNASIVLSMSSECTLYRDVRRFNLIIRTLGMMCARRDNVFRLTCCEEDAMVTIGRIK